MNSPQLFDRNGMATREAMKYARDAANDGMKRALDHAESDVPGWTELALEFVRRYAERNEYFPWYFITMAAEQDKNFPAPEGGQSWGGINRRAQNLGIIEKSDRTMSHPRRHASETRVWRSLVFKGAK